VLLYVLQTSLGFLGMLWRYLSNSIALPSGPVRHRDDGALRLAAVNMVFPALNPALLRRGRFANASRQIVCGRAGVLSYLVEPLLAQNPMSGHLFVFVGRDRRKVRILYWDRTGFARWNRIG
jgi:GAF domain-containing protein